MPKSIFIFKKQGTEILFPVNFYFFGGELR